LPIHKKKLNTMAAHHGWKESVQKNKNIILSSQLPPIKK
jgi:hypothetical protein